MFKIGDRVRYTGHNTPDNCMFKGEIYPVVGYYNNSGITYFVNVGKNGKMDKRCPPDEELELVNSTGCRSNCSNCKGKCDFYEKEKGGN